MKHTQAIKPQDVAVLLKLIAIGHSDWRQIDLSFELEISQGEIAKSLARLKKASLVIEKKVNRLAALEFLTHALKYVFPIEPGPVTIGIPTAVSSPFFENKIVQNKDDVYVWPNIKGEIRGQAVPPLYPNMSDAALKDKSFYHLLTLIDALRIGRARERKIAKQEIEKKVKKA